MAHFRKPVGINVLCKPTYEVEVVKTLKKLTDFQVMNLPKTDGIIGLDAINDIYNETEIKKETNIVEVISVGQDVSNGVESGKFYMYNMKATPVIFKDERLLVIRQDDFLVEVDY